MVNTRGEMAGRLVTGLVIVGLGGIFLANNLGFADIGSIGRFWPVVLILLGVGSVARPGHRRGGAWLLFLGSLLLLHTLDHLRLHDSWPLFIVAVGVGIIWPGQTCCRDGCASIDGEP